MSLAEKLEQHGNRLSKVTGLSRLNLALLGLFGALTVYFAIGVIDYQRASSEKLTKTADAVELMVKNFQVVNEPTIISIIVREKLPKCPADTQVKIAQAIYQVGQTRNIPREYILAIIEKESDWDISSINTTSGACGLMQTIRRWAMPHMDVYGGYTLARLMEPVTNITVGGKILANARDEYFELTGKEDWKIALGRYRWGYEIANNSYADDIIRRSKKYKDRIDAPMKEVQSKTN